MTKEGTTGQMQKPQQLQACRTSASPGEQQEQRQEWGRAGHGEWEQGSASSGELGARRAAGQGMGQKRDRQPVRHTANS